MFLNRIARLSASLAFLGGATVAVADPGEACIVNLSKAPWTLQLSHFKPEHLRSHAAELSLSVSILQDPHRHAELTAGVQETFTIRPSDVAIVRYRRPPQKPLDHSLTLDIKLLDTTVHAVVATTLAFTVGFAGDAVPGLKAGLQTNLSMWPPAAGIVTCMEDKQIAFILADHMGAPAGAALENKAQ